MSEFYLAQWESSLRAVLDSGGEFVLSAQGQSMYPLLRSSEDEVVLQSPNPPFRRGDLFLYRRASGQYVLHRLIRITREQQLIFCGDAQRKSESGILPEQILASVCRIFRDGREISMDKVGYRVYSRLCCFSFFRLFFSSFARFIQKFSSRKI